MEKTYISYPVNFSSAAIADVAALIETATKTVDRDLLLVTLIVMLLCISDPDIAQEEERLRNALDSVSDHICWVLSTRPETDPGKLN